MEKRPIHIRLQLEITVPLDLWAKENEICVEAFPGLPVQNRCGGKHSSMVFSIFWGVLCDISMLANCFDREMSATTHAQTVDGYVSLVEQMTELSAKLNHLSAKITKIDASEEYQQRICQQQERTNEALEILTVIATTDRNTFPERAAAKYVGGHTAIDNTTAESQTGHDERGTAIDK